MLRELDLSRVHAAFREAAISHAILSRGDKPQSSLSPFQRAYQSGGLSHLEKDVKTPCGTCSSRFTSRQRLGYEPPTAESPMNRAKDSLPRNMRL